MCTSVNSRTKNSLYQVVVSTEKRLLLVAEHLKSTRISVDQFVHDVTQSHIALLDALSSIRGVQSLLQRSEHPGPASKLEAVAQKIDQALETLRTLDALYHKGLVFYGPRVPQSQVSKRNVGLEASQVKPKKK